MSVPDAGAAAGLVRGRVRRTRLPRGLSFTTMSAALAAFFVAAGAPTPLLRIYEAEWHFPALLLTVAFGVYAIALLAALLVVGSLSDHVGRRPLLIGALLVELVSMIVFLLAPSIGWIIAARTIQGLATGAATSAFSAAIVELAPEGRKRLGAILTSLSPAAGLGLGALFSGAVAQFDDVASSTVWTVLVIVMAAGTAFAVFVPETVTRRPGALESLVPRIAVPARARRQFAIAAPAQIGAWMTAALFMGLMPIILGSVFGASSPLEIGATAFIEPATAGVTAVLTGRVRPHRLLIAGGIGVIAGSLLVIAAVTWSVLPLLWTGGIVGGFGFGATLSGTIRILTPEAQLHERASLFAAVYFVAYLAFGVPALVAGAFVGTIGVPLVAAVFGIVIAFASGLGLGGQIQLGRRTRRGRVSAASTAPRE
jgi:MFS family permease